MLQPLDLKEGAEDGKNMAARLHAVEKHLRKNPLQGGTFVDKLQRSTCDPLSRHHTFECQSFRCS